MKKSMLSVMDASIAFINVQNIYEINFPVNKSSVRGGGGGGLVEKDR